MNQPGDRFATCLIGPEPSSQCNDRVGPSRGSGEGICGRRWRSEKLGTTGSYCDQSDFCRDCRAAGISESAVEALGAIRGSVDSLQQFIATAAAAVEQQAAVTQDMSSGMQSTANSVVVINDNMTQISSAVGQVGRAVSETRTAAGVLVR